MEKLNSRDLRGLAAAALLIAFAVFIRQFSFRTSGFVSLAASLIRSLIYIGMTFAWSVSISRRILQKSARRCLLTIAGLLIFWLCVRTCKYFLFDGMDTVVRYCWYCYYFPMIFIPPLMICAAECMGRPEDYVVPRQMKLLFLPALVMISIVLTNDLHQKVFAFSGGDPDTLQAGPALMFITIPKVFASMGFGTVAGILFFVLVLFAAITSSIALTESAVSTFEDELHWGRKKAVVLVGVIMLGLGTLSCMGYGPLSWVKLIGMQFLDFFDFLTNSVMMPIAAIATCLLVSKVVGTKSIEEEVMHGESTFRRKKIFNVMIRYLCPIFAAIILISSVANAFGWISM